MSTDQPVTVTAAYTDVAQVAQWAKSAASTGGPPAVYNAACRLLDALRALDGTEWDHHPFVQTRRTCRTMCVCGKSPDHQIHAPETPEDEMTDLHSECVEEIEELATELCEERILHQETIKEMERLRAAETPGDTP
jgi:hypothetical protein